MISLLLALACSSTPPQDAPRQPAPVRDSGVDATPEVPPETPPPGGVCQPFMDRNIGTLSNFASEYPYENAEHAVRTYINYWSPLSEEINFAGTGPAFINFMTFPTSETVYGDRELLPYTLERFTAARSIDGEILETKILEGRATKPNNSFFLTWLILGTFAPDDQPGRLELRPADGTCTPIDDYGIDISLTFRETATGCTEEIAFHGLLPVGHFWRDTCWLDLWPAPPDTTPRDTATPAPPVDSGAP